MAAGDLAAVRRTQRALDRHREREAQLEQERDDAIRAARTAGEPPREIIKAIEAAGAKLSRQRVDQIIRGTR